MVCGREKAEQCSAEVHLRDASMPEAPPATSAQATSELRRGKRHRGVVGALVVGLAGLTGPQLSASAQSTAQDLDPAGGEVPAAVQHGPPSEALPEIVIEQEDAQGTQPVDPETWEFIGPLPEPEPESAPVQEPQPIPAEVDQTPVPVVETAEPTPLATELESTPEQTSTVSSTSSAIWNSLPINWSDVSAQLSEYAVKIGLGILFVTAAIGGIRGTIKAAYYLYSQRKSRKHFYKKEWLNTVSLNVHSIHPRKDGKPKLVVRTARLLELSSFLTNSHAMRRFVSAAKKCTPEQPFPALNYPIENHSWFGDMMRKPFEVLLSPFRKKLDPDVLLVRGRKDGLNRTNKFFRELVSAQSEKGIWNQGLKLPVREERFVIVPMCNVSKVLGKSLVLVAIHDKDFETFGESKAEDLEISAPKRLRRRLQHLCDAHRLDSLYRSTHGKRDYLFPRVTMVFPQYESLEVEVTRPTKRKKEPSPVENQTKDTPVPEEASQDRAENSA